MAQTAKQPIDLKPLQDLLAQWTDFSPRRLIVLLQKAQEIYGYLPIAAMEAISHALEMPMARVYGVATFYSQFRMEPLGEHVIQVCNGTACNVKGSEGLLGELISILGIQPDQTTDDGRFSLLQVSCVGACGIAPAIVLDGVVHGRVTPKGLRKLLKPLLEGAGQPKPDQPSQPDLDQKTEGAPTEDSQCPPHPKNFLERCCNKCLTTEGTPCPEFLMCRLGGVSCHDDQTCIDYRKELRRLFSHKSDRHMAHIFLCKGLTCDASDEPGIKKAFEVELAKRGLLDRVEFIETGCQGLCEVGPVVQLSPMEAFYCRVKPSDVPEIVEEHIIGNRRVERLLYSPEHPTEGSIPFYAAQERRVLSNTGKIDPENIDEYIARDGYKALYQALKQSTPDDVVTAITAAGLRGRGGGGFSTGRKWGIVRGQTDPVRYIVCNADEGDPGAFMDRSLLEGDPHRVIEGMLIGGYAIGAQRGFIYCRAEYPLAIRRLELAIAQARSYGLLGQNILGTGFHLDLEVIQGAGAFVCGEETAMLSSIEGKRGMARNKPPYPAAVGFENHPTCVNNVETFANVPLIIEKGVEWYLSAGTQKSPGTKIFSLSGKVQNTGLIEVPMGISLHNLVHDVGGGAPDGAAIKAAQTGGPSGGCIPARLMEVPIDYDSLTKLGSIMGSGGLVVTDNSTCMVAFAKFFLSFTQHESCGKCIPCREGTKRMLEILDRITEGQGKPQDMQTLKDLSSVIHRTSACGLGQSSPNPVLSTLQYFGEEFEAHITEKKCLAGVCKPLLKYHILDNCRSCGLCAKNCPVDCIAGSRGEVYVIDQERCIKCGRCYDVCPFGAVAKN